jgi:hypothetical protein
MKASKKVMVKFKAGTTVRREGHSVHQEVSAGTKARVPSSTLMEARNASTLRRLESLSSTTDVLEYPIDHELILLLSSLHSLPRAPVSKWKDQHNGSPSVRFFISNSDGRTT